MTFQKLSPEEAATAPASPFTFVTAGDPVETFVADTLTGIIEAIIPEYAELPEPVDGYDAHLDARIGALASIAASFQAGALVSMENDGIATGLTDDQLTALLTQKDGEVLEFEAWESDIPLLLLATNYIPFSDVVPPEGDAIIWLNPHNERLFLTALSHLGIGTLWVNEAAAEAVEEARLQADGSL